ncbi:MAG: MFS transporter [Planctomycetes bacterium]|nr:MFS transporter [Planctomycetota bacterium]
MTAPLPGPASPAEPEGAGAVFARRLPRTVVALGLVSLLNDASAEMIVPLLPVFVLAVGGSASTLGWIEGIADTTAGLFRLMSGALADRVRRKKPLIVAGYALSSGVRPLVALATGPFMVLAVRFLDRVGKGIRGTPRDALVAEITPSGQRGRAFGLHRAMDHAGNVVGPLLAFSLLAGVGSAPGVDDLRRVFTWAALPAALALLIVVFVVREPPRAPRPEPPRQPLSIRPPKAPALRRFLLANLLFGLGGSSDAFLLLRATELEVPIAALPLFPALLSIVRVVLTTPFGALSDRLSHRALIAAGWTLYATVYAGFAFASEAWHAFALIALYGVHYSLVEGAERAWVAELAPPAERGRAYGSWSFVTAIVALPASLLFGVVRDRHGAEAAFLIGAGFATAGLAVLLTGRWPRSGSLPPAATVRGV